MIEEDDFELYGKFCDYLDYSNDSEEKPIPTSKLGLIENAPKEAIEAYKEYQKCEDERVKNGEIDD